MISDIATEALVDRARRRDPDALQALYEEFAPRLYRFALFRVGHPSDAEDLVQRVFVKLVEALPRYEQRGLPFGAWVFRVARNAVVDFERVRHVHEPLDAVAGRPAPTPGPDELAELADDRARLLDAIDTLTPDQRNVVLLRFFAGLGPGEIATHLDRREGSVRALQFRAIAALRHRLRDGDRSPAPAAWDAVG